MGGKNPLFIVVGLLMLLAALAYYQWTVMSENGLLRAESARAREAAGQMKKEKDEVQNRLAETSMSLDDKKRYISDLDGRFLKANADLEVKVKALQQCGDEKVRERARARVGVGASDGAHPTPLHPPPHRGWAPVPP
ncbi:hypothetical protein chiPu_0025215 [Chiloscyllium punctatum]|uniref:Uncharacterized protein n=1 Tax=Chiloscyllium punctatum TaxID=137246 RepID=A0A401TF49_CHIPU|nr:hypothetical protein [Chiloscyllium punctatum]